LKRHDYLPNLYGAKWHTLITCIFFTCVVFIIIGQRLFELKISKRNVAVLLTKGGKEFFSYHKFVIVLQVLWFMSMLGEVWILNRPFFFLLAVVALFATLIGQGLRYLSMQALSFRWTLPIITLPGAPIIKSGIYRYLRHPNWLGVTLEILAIPLIHSAYLTATIFSIANAILIILRIQAEEKALQTDYSAANF
jgi:methyltransferase